MIVNVFWLFILQVVAFAVVDQKKVNQPSLEDKHFIANTYGFLRSSSDNVGSAAQGILGIQSNLDSLSSDLDREYKVWISKKTCLVQENDALRTQIAHAQAELQEQQSLHEEELRLQAEIARVREEREHHSKIVEASRQAWAKEQDRLVTATSRLNQQLEFTRLDQTQKAKEHLDTYNGIKDHNRGLQKQIFELNQELLQMENAASKRRVESGQKHGVLLAQNEGLQTEMHSLQTNIVTQAQLQTEIRSYQNKVATQIDQRLAQQKMTIDMQTKCKAESEGLEGEVKAAQAGLAAAKNQMVTCQVQDAENQRMQAVLNQCLAAQHR